ncbi:hypothetical protein ACFO0N_07390 [Halobium salinum]|uniref:Uncharacterized protein n=1 Tax=Halobium salinum TaxID=1364940 RepID=A0ABD5PA53_9EURY|nr:hypothetical protein [Halobium salinum]
MPDTDANDANGMGPDARQEAFFAEHYARFRNYTDESLWVAVRDLSLQEREHAANLPGAHPEYAAQNGWPEEAGKWHDTRMRLVLVATMLGAREGCLQYMPFFGES